MEIVTRKLILLALLFASLACSTTRLVSLRVEYEERPLGIDVGKPRFSWQMVSSRDGESQSAYQIIVTDEKGDEVWNSGKVSSTLSLNIPYGGRPLQP